MSEENCGDSNTSVLWGTRLKMLILWSLLLTVAVAHKVVDSTEDIGPEAFSNVTTLYPINNNTNASDIKDLKKTPLKDATELIDQKKDSLKDATVWKIDATFAQPDDTSIKENSTENIKNDTKDFRPSQHLGSYIEVEAGPTASTYDSFTPIKKPAAGFESIPAPAKDEHRPFNKQLKDIYKEYPYKFDSSIYTRTKPWSERPDSLRPGGSKANWSDRPEFHRPYDSKSSWSDRPESHRSGDKSIWSQRPDSLESKPTVEAPIRVPAGGLYKYQDPFKEKPDGDEDFGLEFSKGGKETHLKKRGNPFEDLIRLITAFIPVGLIISALTPSLITIEDTGPGHPGYQYPSNVFRRSDTGHSHGHDPSDLGYDPGRPATSPGSDLSSLPVISERCRRRLLCELHSENNYVNRSTQRVGRHCYKIRCEDPEALARTLRWLLEYRQTHHGHT